MCIKYCDGYKYQLRETFTIQTKIQPDKDINTDLVSLDVNGLLTIRKYFAWDGCSGPTIDTKSNMVAGLVHDALYYLMRIGELDIAYRPMADSLLRELMIKHTKELKWFGKIRAGYYKWAVQTFAKSAATPEHSNKVYTAP